MLELNLAKAQELVALAVGTKPEGYVYEQANTGRCQYVEAGEVWNEAEENFDWTPKAPSCLIGTALILGGLTMDDFRDVNDSGILSVSGELRSTGTANIDRHALRYMELAQRSQDAGASWRDAHEHAMKGEYWRLQRNWIEGDTNQWVKGEFGSIGY